MLQFDTTSKIDWGQERPYTIQRTVLYPYGTIRLESVTHYYFIGVHPGFVMLSKVV